MLEFPVWNVRAAGGGWVIGSIAIVHVFVAQFAIGSGLYLAITETMAVRRNDQPVLDFLRSYSNFIMLLTTVFGALGGVGIWFAIGNVNPTGVSALIHNFMFFWAIEWVVFLVEIAIAFFYYYSWGKVSRRFHLQLAWLYYGIAFMSLVIINGILTFMLTPGDWIHTRNIWDAFFNPSYVPSVIVRTAITCSLAGLFSIVACSRIKEESLRVRMLHYSAKWLMPSFFLLPVFLYWYFTTLPPAVAALVQNGIANIGAGNLSVLTRLLLLIMLLSVTIYVVSLLGPFFNPRSFSFGFGLAILALGLAVTGATESVREMLRKPYVIYDYLYVNGARKAVASDSTYYGILRQNKWIPEKTITNQNRVAVGEQIFRVQCLSCHTPSGYRSMTDLAHGWDREFIFNRITTLQNSNLMPPFMGDEAERRALAEYIGDVIGAPPSSLTAANQ
jgi:cytochrome bd-type quinol oxidase subunit 1